MKVESRAGYLAGPLAFQKAEHWAASKAGPTAVRWALQTAVRSDLPTAENSVGN